VHENARLELELMEERNPSIADDKVVEAALHLKPGTTLRAREGSPDFKHSIDLLSDKLARQVKSHREKRRALRRSASADKTAPAADMEESLEA
jgi:putative sigma-54 modulation protein